MGLASYRILLSSIIIIILVDGAIYAIMKPVQPCN